MRFKPSTVSLGLFLLALVFRLAAVLVVGGGESLDSPTYVVPAKSIAEGRGFWYNIDYWTNLYVAEPGYVFFLAFWLVLGVPLTKGIMLVQAVFGALLAPVIYSFVGRRSPRTAAAAAGLYAVDPIAIAPCAFILRELFVMVVITAAVSSFDLQKKIGAALKGVMLGISSLSFPVFGLWPAWVWMMDCKTSPEKRRITAAVVLLGFIVSGAWLVRNAILSKGNFVYRKHLTGVLLYYTANYDFPWLPDTSEPAFQKVVEEAGRRYYHGGDKVIHPEQRAVETRILKDVAGLFLEHPATVTWRFIKANFWFWAEVPGAMGHMKSNKLLHGTILSFHLLQMVFFFAGIGFLAARGLLSDYRFVWSTVLYLAIFVFPFMPIPRYYVAIVPLLDILAAYGAVSLIEFLTRKPPEA